MSDHRFLIVRGLNTNFWVNEQLTLEKLHAAESCYTSASDMYFDPGSPYSVEDAIRLDINDRWSYDNLSANDQDRLPRMQQNAEQILNSYSNGIVIKKSSDK